MTVTIRQAGAHDLEHVLAGRLAFLCEVREIATDDLDPVFVDATRSFLERTHGRSFHTWFADVADTRVGIVSLITSDAPPRPDELRSLDGYIVNMHVDTAHRRQGIGQHLLDVCIAEASELGVRRIDLHATADGRPLYAANDFVDVVDWMARRL